MATYGRHPSGNDAGIGDVGAGDMRASAYGSLTGHAWIYSMGLRAGKQSSGAANPVVEVALYAVDSAGVIQARIGVSGTMTVTAVMVDNASGADYARKPAAPLVMTANQAYALAIRVNAGGSAITHGQDNSGWVMHQRFGIGSAFPTPFGATQVDNQGRISVWADYQLNRRPKTPTNLSPTPNAAIASTLPPMACDFRDDDETLPGFALGTADKISAFQFQILNSSKTSVLKNSGKTAANGTMQTNRRATWTPTGTALAAGTYVARATVWDMTDSPSDVAEWTFTINSGGAFTGVTLNPGSVAGTDAAGNTVVLSGTSISGATWTHIDGTALASYDMQVVDAAGAAIRGPVNAALVVANGASTGAIAWPGAWAALPKATRYRLQLRGNDANGGQSGWASSPYFLVNAAPAVTSLVSPAAGVSMTERPVLVADLTDANDADSALLYLAYVRTGGTGTGTQVASVSFDAATGYWRAYPDAATMPTLGSYEWSVIAQDAWAEQSARSAWRAVNFVAAPVVTLTNPTNGSVVTVATPNVTWTVDRAMSSYRIVLTKVVGGSTVTEWDSGTVPGSVGNVPVPPGRLRNTTTYTMKLTVNTADGLSVTNTSTFSVAYVQPAAVAGYTVAKYGGTYEGPDQSEWSLVRLSWTAPSTGTVSDVDFGGYVVRRVNDATGAVEMEAQLFTRPETSYIDYTARSGTSYTYTVVYLKLVNNIDYVESLPASGSVMVILKNTVITTVDDQMITVPLRYWNNRERTPRIPTEVIETWGPKPQVFQGVLDYSAIKGEFRILDADDGSFSAQDVVAALEAQGRVTYDDNAIPHPKIVCYRDPKRRVMYMTMTSMLEKDQHEEQEGAIVEAEFVENATDAWGVAL